MTDIVQTRPTEWRDGVCRGFEREEGKRVVGTFHLSCIVVVIIGFLRF
jgi:hypothetical protein